MFQIIVTKKIEVVPDCSKDVITRVKQLPSKSETSFADQYYKEGGYPILKLNYKTDYQGKISMDLSPRF